MISTRLIARLDIKSEYLIKGIHLEGLRKIGNPNKFAQKYYKAGADEILFMDCVASLYGRNNLYDVIKKAAKNIFIPIAAFLTAIAFSAFFFCLGFGYEGTIAGLGASLSQSIYA